MLVPKVIREYQFIIVVVEQNISYSQDSLLIVVEAVRVSRVVVMVAG